METPGKASVTAETVDIVGTWRLASVSTWVDGELVNALAMGPAPSGYITYTAEGRVLVVLDRRGLTEAMKDDVPVGPVFAYAGAYTRANETVRHRLEMCSTAADVGTEYVRRIEVDGDRLFLCTQPTDPQGQGPVGKLEWVRDGSP